jgi:hypothetical protein
VIKRELGCRALEQGVDAEIVAIDADFVAEPPPAQRSALFDTPEQPGANANSDRD